MSLAILDTTINSALSYDASASRDRAKLRRAINGAVGCIAPVWPLADYVAVNPYQAWSEHRFEDATERLRALSGTDHLPSWDQLGKIFRSERIDAQAIEQTLHESVELQERLEVDSTADAAERLYRQLQESHSETHTTAALESSSQHDAAAAMPLVADVLSEWYNSDYNHHVRKQIGRFCESHYDQGFASWKSPSKRKPLFESWRESARSNLASPLRGIRRFRRLVSALPSDPEAAIAQCLRDIRLPEMHWSEYLLTLVHSMPGWFAYANYLDRQQACPSGRESYGDSTHATQLLAILASYEWILTKSFGFYVSWPEQLASPSHEVVKDTHQRLVLLNTIERHLQRSLVDRICESQLTSENHSNSDVANHVSAQFVFCIDVRSERVRRCLEETDPTIETMGFAGFFGAPMQLEDVDGEMAVNQLPVLISPAFSVNEVATTTDSDTAAREATETERVRRLQRKSLRSLWKHFSSNAASCFTFVESAGLGYAFRMLQRTIMPWGRAIMPRTRLESNGSVGRLTRRDIEPTCDGLSERGLSDEAQIELAKGILTNLGLTKRFARFVVLVGHESSSENNPLAASLDCGACGGHSGEPNARFVASLLNRPQVRSGLSRQGIELPNETLFVAGVHNTTRCEIQIIEPRDLDQSTQQELTQLSSKVNAATKIARDELATQTQIVETGNSSGLDLLRRSQDWSQVRPEWGLAGNAAFIVGPRELTREWDLGNSAFLHSYDKSADQSGAVLELIMTAPMVVAHWINMQYYASTVNNRTYGSGTKTTHNVVGNFGILSGDHPDLQTGLPLESLSEGSHLVHPPRRLTAIIAAPRHRIDSILHKHGNVAQLVSNQWLHLMAIDEQRIFRRTPKGDWQLERALPEDVAPQEARFEWTTQEPAMA